MKKICPVRPLSMTFIHLRTHSSYSLSEGAIKFDDLIARAIEFNMPAVAVTDSGNMFGSLEFSYGAMGKGIQPIVGAEVEVVLPRQDISHQMMHTGKLVLIAKDAAGYQNLIKLVSVCQHRKMDAHGLPLLELSDFDNRTEGIIALTGGVEGMLGRLLIAKQTPQAGEVLERLQHWFGDRLYMEITRTGHPDEAALEPLFLDLAYRKNIPLVATNNVFFLKPEMHEAANALLCIAGGRYVSEPDRPQFQPQQYFKSSEEMEKLFADFPEAIRNTVTIAKRCAIMSPSRNPMLPNFPTAEGRTEDEELVYQAREGLKKRIADSGGAITHIAEYEARLQFELDVIIRMKFPGYFLIVSDFIRWAKEAGIPVGPGRGSGAGSLVAWSLLITDLDPIRFGLLFERFLNPERVSMPDFDIDFCQERRDEVIKYVCDKYGADRVAHIITFGKLQARAVLRDVGRVLQMPYGQVDRICKLIPFDPQNPVTLQQAINLDLELQRERDSDPTVAKLLAIGLQLEGLHRHASIHAAGVVIGNRPLDELIPIYYDPRSPIPITQYAMKQAEQSGLVKFDFLGLKTLTMIAEAVRLVNLRVQSLEFGEESSSTKLQTLNSKLLDITNIPLDDLTTFKMLSEGKATGVFQMESAGMRDALRKMKPDTLEDIIALISLYRPGPMENIPTYIARKHKREKPDYLHPLLQPCLQETFGVIIYQEQVMEIARVLSGYSLGGADLLRRAMGKKIKAEMDAQCETFIKGAVANGVDAEKAADIFKLVDKFAGYGFNKSHAAAYALIGYQTAYLKANYPVEFLAACMNIDMGDTDKLATYREEAMQSGVVLLPPDVNISTAKFAVEEFRVQSLESGEGDSSTKLQTPNSKLCVRYALAALKGVGAAAMQALVEERNKNGAYKDILDLAERLDPKVFTKRQIESLAKSGGLDSIEPNRRMVVENAALLSRYNADRWEEKHSKQVSLFGDDVGCSNRPQLHDFPDWPTADRLIYEYESIGFYLDKHPLDEYQEQLKNSFVTPIRNAGDKLVEKSSKLRLAGVVTSITRRVSGARRFTYFKLSDPTGLIEISIFDDALIDRSRDLLESKKPLLIIADGRKDEGGIRLIADEIKALDMTIKKIPEQLHLVVEQPDNIIKLMPFLKTRTGGDAVLKLTVKLDNSAEIACDFPEKFSLNANELTAFGFVQ